MIKHYCDCCDKEIEGEVPYPNQCITVTKERNGKKMDVRLYVQLPEECKSMSDGVNITGHFCKGCMLDAINTLDDRPRPG